MKVQTAFSLPEPLEEEGAPQTTRQGHEHAFCTTLVRHLPEPGLHAFEDTSGFKQ